MSMPRFRDLSDTVTFVTFRALAAAKVDGCVASISGRMPWRTLPHAGGHGCTSRNLPPPHPFSENLRHPDPSHPACA